MKSSNIKAQMSKLNTIRNIFLALVIMMTPMFNANAQTNTVSPSEIFSSPTKSIEDKEIQTLKEKIATKVAELREKNSKAISGIVQEISLPNSRLKIKTWKDED